MDVVGVDPASISTTTDLAAALTAVRERAGLTVRQLHRPTGIVPSTLGGYFAGRHRPSVDGLERVLRACGVHDPDELAGWTDALLRVRHTARRRPRSDEGPYRGLESFRAGDAGLFFGRSALTALVVERILDPATPGPLVVVGPSGSGKSSLLAAGVEPALGGSARVLAGSPGRAPLESLRRLLAGAETDGDTDANTDGDLPTVLVVDQFEEVFAPGVGAAERAEFVTALAAAPARVVIGLRADFYSAALHHEELALALRSPVTVGPMDADGLREVITGPAGRAGLLVEDGLVELLLGDLDRGDPPAGALPLLSHALLATWRRSDGVRLTVADYRAVGGVARAVAQTAEEAVTALGPEQEEAVRLLFLRLVHVAPGMADTRRRIDRDEVAADGVPADGVLAEFVARRLVVVDESSVEIAHEALLTAWPRLRTWIDTDRVGIVAHRQLTESAGEWDRTGRDPDLLLRGARLVAATERVAYTGPELNALERAFLDASQEQERRRGSFRREQARRLRTLVAALAVLLLLAVGLGVFSLVQRLQIGRDRDAAVSRQLAVRADALRDEDVSLAALLAVAAYRIAPTPQARSSLLSATAGPVPTRLPGPVAVTQDVAVGPGLLVSSTAVGPTVQVWRVGGAAPVLLGDTPPAAGPVQAVALSRDGRTLATGGASGEVALFDLTDPARPGPARAVTGAGGAVFDLAFTPDGSTLVAGTADGSVRRWSLTGAGPVERPPLTGPAGPVQSVAVSPDGTLLAAGGADQNVHLWTLSGATPGPPLVLTGPAGKVYSVAFGPDGRTLAAGSADRSVHRWDVTDPARPVAGAPLTGPTNWVNAVAFSPDGRTIAGGSSDGNAWVWDAGSGRVVEQLPHPGPVTAAAFVDGGTLATGEADGVAHLWPVPGPVLTGFGDSVFALDYSADGGVLAIGPGSKDGTARLWSTSGPSPEQLGEPIPNPAGEPGFSGSAALTPDGRTLAVGRVDGSVRLWDVSVPARPVLLGAPLIASTGLVEQLVVNADGTLLAVSGDDDTVRLWDLAVPSAARLVATLTGPQSIVLASAFSPDGRLLAAASADTRTYLWDLADPARPRPLGSVDGPSSYAYSPAFSPDGRTLAVGSADKTVRLYDVADPAHPRQLGPPLTGPSNYVYSVAFSPDGATLAAASTDGDVWLYDVADPYVAGAEPPRTLATLSGPTDAAFSVVWSPDGSTVVAGSADRTVRVWLADPDRAAERLCAVAGAPPTPQEWERYVPDLPYSPPCAG